MFKKKQKLAVVTGAAGFIGFHVAKELLDNGWRVIGFDCMSNYYNVALKERRESILKEYDSYAFVHEKLESKNVLLEIFATEKPDIVIHLAAQAGVRYSIENPRSYLESNIVGTFELLEAARAVPPKHMLLASTSSAYGATDEMPLAETQKADNQVSFYAATKKATENMSHSYSHLYNLPITMFRFFTVYGPWGRPDMAPSRFANAILNDTPIEVYNRGQLWRDFTYISDLVEAIMLLVTKPPLCDEQSYDKSKSNVAPFRVINIGNSQKVHLNEFIDFFELALNKKAFRNYTAMQPGDVIATWADCSILKSLTGYRPSTPTDEGVKKFCDWFVKEGFKYS